MDEVTAHQFVKGQLPVAVLPRSGIIFDEFVNPRSIFGHLTLDVEDERLLAEVSIHDLTRGLQADSWV